MINNISNLKLMKKITFKIVSQMIKFSMFSGTHLSIPQINGNTMPTSTPPNIKFSPPSSKNHQHPQIMTKSTIVKTN